MTDEQRDKALIAEIDAISRSLPDIPSSYGELRALIARLPEPTLPDIRSARTGADQTSDVTGFGSAQSPLSGDPIGQESGSGIGVYPQLFYGKSNLLKDPMIQQASTISPIPITTPAPNAWDQWQAHYLLNSGTAPTTRNWIPHTADVDTGGQALNSNMGSIGLTAFPAGAGSIDVFIRSLGEAVPNPMAYHQPYLVGAWRMARPPTGTNSVVNITSITAWAEIVDDAGTVLATSTPFDYLAFYNANNEGSTSQIVAAYLSPTSATIHLRLRVRVVGTNTGASVQIAFGEPILAESAVETPPPFSPIVAAWHDSTWRTGLGIILRNALGEHAWDSTRQLLMAFDGTRQRPVSETGWLPFAFPWGMANHTAFANTTTLPINGGSLAVPIFLEAPMLLQSYTIGQKDAAGIHALEVRLYEDRQGGNVNFVTGSDATFAYTPAAADVRVSTAVSGAPVVLGPGLYWVVLRNTSAAVTAGIGAAAVGTYALVNQALVKTLAAALPALLDLVTGWTKGTGGTSIVLNGRIRGDVAAF